ncbi:CHAT domain-containing protein, partial [Crocosphaera sp. XPORK-15E]|uniref:CHAT domain-containing protein n=1 Tax=Crocosphaera sp. XPORK-15E TaxID=3110247 RepID=UPI002B1EFF6B
LLRSKHRDDFEIITSTAVRYRDIQRAILDNDPNIVHFCGHGDGEQGLVFEDMAGGSKLVDSEALSGLFALFVDKIECVVLNACYSEVHGSAIAG